MTATNHAAARRATTAATELRMISTLAHDVTDAVIALTIADPCRLADKGHVCTQSPIMQIAEHFVRSLPQGKSTLGNAYSPYSTPPQIDVLDPPAQETEEADILPSMDTLHAMSTTNKFLKHMRVNAHAPDLPVVPLDHIDEDSGDIKGQWASAK